VIFEVVATLSVGVFSGAALYINLVEHPAAMKIGVEYAARGFLDRYHRGATMQAPTAVVGLAASIAAWATGSGVAWLAGALLLGAVVPFTLLVIAPTTNRSLLDPSLDPASPRTKILLDRWWWLHGARTVLSIAAFLVFTASVAR
jgi:hypothetical protein